MSRQEGDFEFEVEGETVDELRAIAVQVLGQLGIPDASFFISVRPGLIRSEFGRHDVVETWRATVHGGWRVE